MTPDTKLYFKGSQIFFWCQGCNQHHCINKSWGYNEDPINPTFSNSILCKNGHFGNNHKEGDNCWCNFHERYPESLHPVPYACGICHSFIRNGNIEFLDDCTHALAGTTLPLEMHRVN